MATYNTILILGGPGAIRPPEPIANEIITPGHLMKYSGLHTDLGPTQKVGLQASAAGVVLPLFALEADYSGVSGSATKRIDANYASGDHVHAYIAERGARIYAWLASGENVAAEQLLLPAAGGALRLSYLSTGIARATEAVNASAGAARIPVEVL